MALKSLMANELILIIEDNEKNRKLIRDLLQVKGYQTIESETAEDGLKLADEKMIQEVILPYLDSQIAAAEKKSG